jgi:hypothetical protein
MFDRALFIMVHAPVIGESDVIELEERRRKLLGRSIGWGHIKHTFAVTHHNCQAKKEKYSFQLIPPRESSTLLLLPFHREQKHINRDCIWGGV